MKLFTYLTKPFVLFMLLFALGVGQMWAWDLADGRKVYFDMQNCTDFGTPYFRIGRHDGGDWSAATQMTLVSGTKYLYIYTQSGKWESYGAFSVADGKGFTNSNNIYQPWSGQPGSEGYTGDVVISKQTLFQKYDVTSDAYINITGTGTSSNGCQYYQANGHTTDDGGALTALPSYSVTYNTPDHGTLTVTRYDGSSYNSFSSGADDFKPTEIIKITTSAATHYVLDELEVVGATQIESGDTYYVTANCTITATFAPQWSINGTMTSPAWDIYNGLEFVSDNTYRGEITLAAGTAYNFKVLDRATNTWYGCGTRDNDYTYVGQTDAVLITSTNVSGHNVMLMTRDAGAYTFEWDDDDHTLKVTYPNTVSHPSVDYVYMEKYSDWNSGSHCYLHPFYNDGGSGETMTTWGSDNPKMTAYTHIGNKDYYCFPILTTYPNFIAKNNLGASSDGHETSKMYTSGHGGQLVYWKDASDGWTWGTFSVHIALNDLTPTTPVDPTYMDVAFNSDVLTDLTTVPTKTHYDFGGFYTGYDEVNEEVTGVQVINAAGEWIASVDDYTDASKHWIHAGMSTTLYAKWTEHEYAVTLAISPAGAGTTSPASSTTAKYVTASGNIEATANSGYSFRDWDFSKTDAVNDIYCADTYTSTSNPVHIHAVHDGTLTANFTPNTYTVSFENLSADAGHKGSLDTTVTFNDTIHMKGRIEVPSKTNYDFGGYYISTDKGATLTNIQIIDANGNWNKGVSGYTGTKDGVASWVCAGDTVLYAKWTETAYTITPSVSPAGAGSVNTVTDAHLVTPSSTITATPVNAAWVFDRWEYGEHVGCASGCSTNSVTVTSDMNSTITAHFKPRYELVGCIWDNSGNGGMPGWNYDGTGEFTVNSFTALGTGEGTGVDLSYSCTLWANTTYKFEVHDRVTGNHGKYYAAGQYLNDGEHALLNQMNNDVPLAAIGAGTYTFRITNMTYDGTTDDYFPTITVERPHQMHMGHKRVDIDGTSHSDDTGGTLTASTGGNSLANGDWYNYGANITYTASAQSGYTLTWYTNDSYTSEFPQQPAATWPHDNVTGDENVYAKFTEKSTAVTFSATNGKVQIASTDKANTTVGITTSREITAVPNTGYSFSSWTVPGGADFSVESTSSATTTLSGLGAGTAGTLTANFTENMHAVAVTAGSGGSVSSDPALSDGKVTIGITTSATLTATPANAAWVFKNWTGDIDDGITIASGSATSAMITINATADSKSITANFEPRYGLHGSLANDTPGGMPRWTGDGADFAVGSFSGIGEGDGKGVDLQCACTLEPNKEYKFRIYDRAADGRWGYSSSVTLGAGESLELSTYGDVSGKDVTIYTVGYGTYTFKITNMYDNGDGKYYPKVTVDRPTSYQFNMGCTEGGTVTAATTAGSGYAITNGQYVAAGDDIQFHAVPAAGYAFDHWYTASDYATSFNDNKDMKMNNISETVNAYAKFVPVTVTYNDGSGDGKWSTASNWSPACVPTIDHDVVITKPVTVDIAHATAKSIVLDQNSKTGKLTIEANKGLEVVGTITRTTDGTDRLATREEDLVLESSSAGNASLIFDNNNSDAATVQMYSKASISGDTWNWQFMGTPFTSANALYSYYGSYLYEWKSSGDWDVVPNGGTMTPFTGYCITQSSATTYTMSGTLNPTSSDKAISIPSGLEFVMANSWTAPIFVSGFTNTTLPLEDQNIYLFNTGHNETGATEGSAPGTYVAVPIHSAPYTGADLIAPMEGFYVDNRGHDAATITLKYNELVRPQVSRDIIAGAMHAPKRVAAEAKPDVMKIKATGSRYADRVVILAREDFSTAFDNGWDGKNINEPGVAPIIYALRADGTKDAVSAIPTFEGTVVGFRQGEDNQYTFSFEYDGEDLWYLNDLKLQKSTLIDAEHTYAFSTIADDAEARFIISATPIANMPTGIGNDANDANDGMVKVRKLIINDQLYIIRAGRMYNAVGSIVK